MARSSSACASSDRHADASRFEARFPVTSFTASTERVLIAGPAGTLEIVVNAPDTARRGVALVAHPNPQQGGTLDNKVAQTLAKAFHALDYVAVRFNFRGVGASQGSFDD